LVWPDLLICMNSPTDFLHIKAPSTRTVNKQIELVGMKRYQDCNPINKLTFTLGGNDAQRISLVTA